MLCISSEPVGFTTIKSILQEGLLMDLIMKNLKISLKINNKFTLTYGLFFYFSLDYENIQVGSSFLSTNGFIGDLDALLILVYLIDLQE